MKTEATTRARLGPDLLTGLAANLWAIDCQTCNRPLGRRKPSLTVAESDGVAEAAPHHPRRQAPRWETTTRLPRFGLHQGWRSGGFAVRGMTPASCHRTSRTATNASCASDRQEALAPAGTEDPSDQRKRRNSKPSTYLNPHPFPQGVGKVDHPVRGGGHGLVDHVIVEVP